MNRESNKHLNVYYEWKNADSKIELYSGDKKIKDIKPSVMLLVLDEFSQISKIDFKCSCKFTDDDLYHPIHRGHSVEYFYIKIPKDLLHKKDSDKCNMKLTEATFIDEIKQDGNYKNENQNGVSAAYETIVFLDHFKARCYAEKYHSDNYMCMYFSVCVP